MSKKWNEEVVELLVDLNDLLTAEKKGSETLTNLLYMWVEEYFGQKNFENSLVLNFAKTSKNHLRITVLQKKMIISVNTFGDTIKIDKIINGLETQEMGNFVIGTFKNEKSSILSRKVLFELIDEFTREAIENYVTDRIYL